MARSSSANSGRTKNPCFCGLRNGLKTGFGLPETQILGSKQANKRQTTERAFKKAVPHDRVETKILNKLVAQLVTN
jgi:hypothetical protein